jgi:hypothetical protein
MIPWGRSNGLFRFLAVAVILFATATSLYGAGARDTSALSQADRLIAYREHDQAIRILSNFMRENPERFAEGQTRLRRIVQFRQLYNQIMQMLIDTLETEPENDQRILELSNMLLSLESPAAPHVGEFLAQVRFIAEFNINRRRLQHIFQIAGEQLRRNEFSAALATYASGLDIFQSAFFEGGYGAQAEFVARSGLDSINRSIQEFNSLVPPFTQAISQLTALAAAPGLPAPGELRAVYSTLPPLMVLLANLREDFSRVMESYATQLAVLQQEHDIQGDRSFLSFAGWLISGPPGQREGMLGTIDQFWDFLIQPVDTALANIVSRSYQSGYAAMENLDFAGGISFFDTTAHYVTLAQEMVRDKDAFFARAGSPRHTVHGQDMSAGAIGAYLRFRAAADSLLFLPQAGIIGIRGMALEALGSPSWGLWLAGTIGSPQAFSHELELRRSLQEELGGLRTLYTGIASELQTVLQYEEIFSAVRGLGSPHTYLAQTQRLVSNIFNRLNQLDSNVAIRKYTIANADLEERLAYTESIFAEGYVLIQGLDRWTEGFGAYVARYPAEGILILSRASQNLDTDIAFASDVLGMYAAEDSAAFASAEMSMLYAATQALFGRLLALQNQNLAAIAAAGTLAERAQALRFDGDRLFQSAQSALTRNDFNAARGDLMRAVDQFDASLALQESSSLRAFRDNNAVALGAEIVRVENEIVVRDVRNLVTSARTSFFAGNMEHAENLLIQAQNRWRVTNVTEQPEVEHWLRMVRGALALNMARVIPPTAPLFAEMSQLLSSATGGYHEGVRLLNAGQRAQGIEKFNESLEQTREVRLMFPMNHSARMLELRIEQQTDMPAFNAAFQQRLNEAVAGTRERDIESFATLQDLAEINPQFPGIQNMLFQAEIAMGFRPPPPNPANLARSAELAGTAAAHINSRDPIRMGVAEAQLEEALSLNPDNIQAQALLDELSVLLTGTGTFVLSSHAQTQYNAALQEFLRGNHLTANAIVQQLLQDPESQRSRLVQDLRRRIDAFL